MTRTGYPTRRGYTLVELLVVMSLMILLAALAVGVSYSGMVGSQKVISGADRASGWLLIAKQRALRDGAPRGVRFALTQDSGNYYYSTEAQYIEQPDVWVPNPAQEGKPNGARIVFVYQYNGANQVIPPNQEIYFVSSDTNDITEYMSRVSNGDSLILPEFGASFRITDRAGTPTIAPPPFANTNYRKIVLEPTSYPNLAAAGTPLPPPGPPPANVSYTMVTYKFGFQGAPQLLLGEPVLQLSSGAAIDFRAGVTQLVLGAPVDPTPYGYRTWSVPQNTVVNAGPYNPPTSIGITPDSFAAPTYFDIVFAPSGQVLNNANSLICLWVRDPEKTKPANNPQLANHPRLDASGKCDTRGVFDLAGEQALVVVSVKSGLINTQPVNPPPAVNPAPGSPSVFHDPYIFARDGLSSGL